MATAQEHDENKGNRGAYKKGQEPMLDYLVDFLAKDFPGHLNAKGASMGGGGGEEGGGGGGGGGGAAAALEEARRTNQLIEAQKGLIDQFTESEEDFNDRMASLGNASEDAAAAIDNFMNARIITETSYRLGLQNLITTLANLRQKFINFGADLVDGSFAMKRWNNAWTTSTEMSNRAMGGFTAYLENLNRWGPNLSRALENLTNAISENANAFVFQTGSFVDYANALRDARRGLESSTDIAAYLDQDQQIMLLQRANTYLARSGNREEINSRETQQTAQRMFDVYLQIAANTGRTVEEVMKLQEQPLMDIAALQASGFLSAQEAEDLLYARAAFEQMGLAEQFDKAIQSIPTGGVEFLQDPDVIMSGLGPLMDEILRRRGTGEFPEGEELNELIARYAREGQQLPSLEAARQTGALVAAREMEFERPATPDPLLEAVRRFTAAIDDFAGPFLDLLGMFSGAIVAAHTAAMLIHSAALGANGSMLSLLFAPLRGIATFLQRAVGVGSLAQMAAMPSAGVLGSIAMMLLRLTGVLGSIAMIVTSIFDAFEETEAEAARFEAGLGDFSQSIGRLAADLFPALLGVATLIVMAIASWPVALVVGIGALVVWAIDSMTDGWISNTFGRLARDMTANVMNAWGEEGSLTDVVLEVLRNIWNLIMDVISATPLAFVRNFGTGAANWIMDRLGFDGFRFGEGGRFETPVGGYTTGVNAPSLDQESVQTLLEAGGANASDGYDMDEIRRAIEEQTRRQDDLSREDQRLLARLVRAYEAGAYSSN